MWQKELDAAGFFAQPPIETIDVDESLGRVAAGSVYAVQSAPHYNSAAMDGIAVRAADTFGAQETAPLILEIKPNGTPFAAGYCYIVDTGDVMPPGTNAVIMIEDVQRNGQAAEIIAAASPWVRRAAPRPRKCRRSIPAGARAYAGSQLVIDGGRRAD